MRQSRSRSNPNFLVDGVLVFYYTLRRETDVRFDLYRFGTVSNDRRIYEQAMLRLLLFQAGSYQYQIDGYSQFRRRYANLRGRRRFHVLFHLFEDVLESYGSFTYLLVNRNLYPSQVEGIVVYGNVVDPRAFVSQPILVFIVGIHEIQFHGTADTSIVQALRPFRG